MKNLSLIAAIATASLISFQASGAGFYNSTAVESKMIKGEIVSTQSQAYADGKKMWSDLSDKKSFELSQVLLQSNDKVDVKSFELRNGSVEVQEFLDSSGTISFVPMVKVDYRYNYRPSL